MKEDKILKDLRALSCRILKLSICFDWCSFAVLQLLKGGNDECFINHWVGWKKRAMFSEATLFEKGQIVGSGHSAFSDHGDAHELDSRRFEGLLDRQRQRGSFCDLYEQRDNTGCGSRLRPSSGRSPS